MTIRAATLEDFDVLYEIGLTTPELRVTEEAFMSPEEFRWCITMEDGIFRLAEVAGEVAGFAFANLNDIEVPQYRYGCLVYLVSTPPYRGKGVSRRLLEAVEEEARERGIAYLYTWARMDDDRFVEGSARRGWIKGIPHLWMHLVLQPLPQEVEPCP